MNNISLIACVSQDFGLGYANQLLWRIPADLQFFKQTTMGGVVVMGRKTFASIGHPLPGRINVVLSKTPLAVSGVNWCTSESALREFLRTQTMPIFIIGGASLYRMFIQEAKYIYLTEVSATKPADTFFPDFNHADYLTQTIQTGDSDGICYQTIKYTRK